MTDEQKFMTEYKDGERGREAVSDDVTYLGGYERGQRFPRTDDDTDED